MKPSDYFANIGRPVAYYPHLTDITGNKGATLLLSQLFYWEGKQLSSTGWIYKTQEELWEETRLTRGEQETARRILREKGFIEETYQSMPRRLFFRLCLGNIAKALEEKGHKRFNGYRGADADNGGETVEVNEPKPVGGLKSVNSI